MKKKNFEPVKIEIFYLTNATDVITASTDNTADVIESWDTQNWSRG